MRRRQDNLGWMVARMDGRLRRWKLLLNLEEQIT